MNDYLPVKNLLETIETVVPGRLDHLMGRRIPRQAGYASAAIAANLHYMVGQAQLLNRHASFRGGLTLVAQRLRELRFPVWHLDPMFARLLHSTSLADDLHLWKIDWFAPGGTVLLPAAFSRRWFEPFICPALHFRVCPEAGRLDCPDFQYSGEVTGPRLMLVAPLMTEDLIGAELVASLPLDRTAGEALALLGTPAFSTQDIEEIEYREAVGAGRVADLRPEQETRAVGQMLRLGLLLGLVVGTEPSAIMEPGERLRPARTVGRRVVPELRNPCWLGRTLGRETERLAEQEHGRNWRTAAWLRRGHLRQSRHGAGRLLVRTIWIRPVICRRNTAPVTEAPSP